MTLTSSVTMLEPPSGCNLTWKRIGDLAAASSDTAILGPRVMPRLELATAPFIGGSAASSGVIRAAANADAGATTRAAANATRMIVVRLFNIENTRLLASRL